jgi:hypothetical protein
MANADIASKNKTNAMGSVFKDKIIAEHWAA